MNELPEFINYVTNASNYIWTDCTHTPVDQQYAKKLDEHEKLMLNPCNWKDTSNKIAFWGGQYDNQGTSVPTNNIINMESNLMGKRLVRVIIADTDENLPLESMILYKSDEMFTDLTDQELFFQIGIKELLEKHNALRTNTRDKKRSEKMNKEVNLELARIRDLKMVVISLAEF